jgi:trimeric autotransporter adhesin
VLITGGLSPTGVLNSAELYDPATQNFTPTGTMNVQRWLHTATLLNTGEVLITGGLNSATQTALNSAELYDPASGTFTLLGINLNFARGAHTATLVSTGQVLIVGGYDPANGIIPSAELYDPRGVFYDLGNTNTPRMRHTATVLQSGLVLITVGETDLIPSGAYNSAETYNPTTFQFTALPATMTTVREGHFATLLNNGQVLLAGGDLPGTGSLSSAEIYDPSSATFTAIAASMTTPRVSPVATPLDNGKILIAGGATDSAGSSVALNSAETYDPAAQAFTSAGTMSSARERQTVTMLNNGVVLVDGGTDGNNIFNTADLYSAAQLTGLTSITVTPASPSIAYGTQQIFSAIGTFSNGSMQTISSAQWTSSSSSVLAIGNDATDSGFAASGLAGTATITASAAGISGSTTATVLSPPLAYVYVYPSATAVAVGTIQQFSLYGVYADGSTQNLTAGSVWVSSNSAMASVSSAGVVTGVSQGEVTIQATYGSFSATAQVYVTPPYLSRITVTPATSTIPLGTTEQFQAIGTYTDGSTQNITNIAQWSAGINGVATESASGLAKGTNQGTTTIVAGYGEVYGYASLTVAAPVLQSLSVTSAVAGVDVGSSQQFKATGNYSDGSSQDVTSLSTWISSNSNVATVNTAGLATALVIGTSTITATYGSISGTAPPATLPSPHCPLMILP